MGMCVVTDPICEGDEQGPGVVTVGTWMMGDMPHAIMVRMALAEASGSMHTHEKGMTTRPQKGMMPVGGTMVSCCGDTPTTQLATPSGPLMGLLLMHARMFMPGAGTLPLVIIIMPVGPVV